MIKAEAYNKNKREVHLGQRFNCVPVEGGGDRTPQCEHISNLVEEKKEVEILGNINFLSTV